MNDEKIADAQAHPSPTEPTGADRPRGRQPNVLQILLVIATLGAGVIATALTSDVTGGSEPGVVLVNGQPYLPDKAADWTGGELGGMTEPERKLLPADTEAARRVYTDNSGNEVYCSLVLAGREVTSIHRPELCLPGQGWKIQGEHTESIPTAAAQGGELKVMRMNAVQSVKLSDGRTFQSRAVFIYWFVGKNRITPYHWQRILWTTKDRVLHNVNHRWAYFLIQKVVSRGQVENTPEKSDEESMRMIKRFVQDIYPELVPKQR
jgi:hypothetical protein